MKRILGAAAVLFFITGVLFTLRVDENEIKKGDQKINFNNYRGEYNVSESENEIEDIGRKLSEIAVRKNEVFQYKLQYSIIHAVSDQEPGKLNADIVLIDKESRVRHINGLRLILASYLAREYGYNKADSKTIATFVTFYNAVYRRDMTYFSGHYKSVVAGHLSSENAGISLDYYDWPGRTRLVIPLTDETNKRPNTDEVSDKKVIDELKKTSNRGVDERSDMVDLKEKELKKKQEELERERQMLSNQQTELNKNKEEVKTKKEEITNKEEDLNELKNKKNKTEEDKEKINKKEEDLTKEKETVKKKEDEVKKEETTVEKTKEDLTKKEDTVAKKDADIKKEKEDIHKDVVVNKIDQNKDEVKNELVKKDEALNKKESELATNELKQKEKEKELDKREELLKKNQVDEKIFAGKLYYLKVMNYFADGRYHNDLYIINALSRKIELRSPLTNITGKKYDIFMDGVVVIAQDEQNAPDNLVILDRDTLEVKARGKDTIFWRSFVDVREDNIYAIVIDGGDFYLARFNGRLERTDTSSVKVDRDSFISFYGDFIYVNSDSKTIIVLNKKDLKYIEDVKP